MSKKKRNSIYNLLFLVVLFGITFYFLLKDQELSDIIQSVEKAKKWYLLIGLVLVIIYVVCESVIICYLMHIIKRNILLKRCIKYSFIGFFFSCITPSATGGQPAQIYFMKKDKVDISYATLVLMDVTMAYKAVLVFLGFFIIFWNPMLLQQHLGKTAGWFYFGMICNVVFIGILFLAMCASEPLQFITDKAIRFLHKCKIIKNEKKVLNKVNQGFSQYQESAGILKKHKLVMVNIFLISMVQRVCLFAVTYMVYRAFGLNQSGALEIIILQAVISIAVDMLPLPGGIGASENMFLEVFKENFGARLVVPGMLLSRGISYYALLIISAIVLVYAYFVKDKNLDGKKKYHKHICDMVHGGENDRIL